MRRVLVVFVDALGPRQSDLLGGSLADLAHRRSLRGILGYSCGALPTILTGTLPRAHGRMCTFRRAEGDSVLRPLRWLGLLPSLLHERGPVRRAAVRALRRRAAIEGYLDLYKIPPSELAWLDVAEREDLFQADAIGGQRSFLADARAAGLRVDASPWQLPEDVRWDEALQRAARSPADLTFLYATQLDGVMHRHGTRGPEATRAARAVATRIAHARDLLSRGAELTTFVVGDHGMADVTRTADPRPVVEGTGVRAFVDSTFLRVWGDAASLAKARGRFLAHDVPGKWLDRDDLAVRGAPVDGSPYGDAVAVLDEGVVFSPSFVGGVPRGMHGYDVASASASAALLSDAPLPSSLASLADVAPAVRSALGLGGGA